MLSARSAPLVARSLPTCLREDILALRKSLAQAELVRETWRASGNVEKHLEACSLVSALELRLEALESAQRLTAEGRQAQQQVEIVFNGRQYCYGPYRYDRLADAESYAKLLRARPGGAEAELGPAQAHAPSAVEEPDRAAQEQMRALGIAYERGTYRLDEYRYDRLADAVAYARLLGRAA